MGLGKLLPMENYPPWRAPPLGGYSNLTLGYLPTGGNLPCPSIYVWPELHKIYFYIHGWDNNATNSENKMSRYNFINRKAVIMVLHRVMILAQSHIEILRLRKSFPQMLATWKVIRSESRVPETIFFSVRVNYHLENSKSHAQHVYCSQNRIFFFGDVRVPIPFF